MLLRAVLSTSLACLGFWACGCSRETPEQLFAAGEAAVADTASLDQAVASFNALLQRFPEHASCAGALKHLAAIAQQRRDMPGAVALYERLLAEYPKSEYCDEAQFMIGFIYEDELRDLERARQAYQRVIDSYPQSELAASAKILLPNLGRSPEEWVKFQDLPSPP